MVRTKICGNRSVEEVSLAAAHGADAVGLIRGVTHTTEDEIDVETGRAILQAVPVFVDSVLVTHLEDSGKILEVYDQLSVLVIQLHSDISLTEIRALRAELPPGVRLIKAIHVDGESAIERARTYESAADALLLDSRTADRLGGTGQTHNWSISSRIVELIRKPVILAGGLTPDNVEDAIRQVRPYGVDVNSGVEFRDGRKDPAKVASFICRAR